MRNYVIALVLSIVGMLAGCGTSGDPADNFVGSYQTTVTLSGGGSQTFTDSVTIQEGETSDLIMVSQQMGTLRLSIVGKSSIAIEQQQVTFTGADGGAFSVTVQGQGTIVENVFNASGTLSTSSGTLSFTMAGQRL
jgi:hypothetical protein